MGTPVTPEDKAYREFEKKVERTVFLDKLAPHITGQIIKSALGQFGAILSVHFLPNYTVARDIPQAALVEMQNANQARALVEQMTECPFMISAIPRPVRVKFAKAVNFSDRPRRPNRKIKFRWLKYGNPNFDVAKKLRTLVRKHAAESAVLLKHQLQEEEKLAKQHKESLETNYRKYELIEKAFEDGSVHRLAAHYNIQLKGT